MKCLKKHYTKFINILFSGFRTKLKCNMPSHKQPIEHTRCDNTVCGLILLRHAGNTRRVNSCYIMIHYCSPIHSNVKIGFLRIRRLTLSITWMWWSACVRECAEKDLIWAKISSSALTCRFNLSHSLYCYAVFSHHACFCFWTPSLLT